MAFPRRFYVFSSTIRTIQNRTGSLRTPTMDTHTLIQQNQLLRPDNYLRIYSSQTYLSLLPEKENLYLYITPHSAHPPGILKSLVYGLLRKYKIQNTYKEDFTEMVSKLFSRLLARGYNPNTLARLFKNALDSLTVNSNGNILRPTQEKKKGTHNDTLFFKTKYNQSSLPRSLIQSAFQDTCNISLSDQSFVDNDETDRQDVLKNVKLTIAFSREKNLRDILIPSKLHSTKK